MGSAPPHDGREASVEIVRDPGEWVADLGPQANAIGPVVDGPRRSAPRVRPFFRPCALLVIPAACYRKPLYGCGRDT